MQGDYKFQGTSGGMDYWVNFDYAIWYKEAGENIISFWWLIGLLEDLDTSICVMYSMFTICLTVDGITLDVCVISYVLLFYYL